MQIKATRKFSAAGEGHVLPGRVLNVSESRARELVGMGLAEHLEIKPDPKSYQVKPAPSSRADRPQQGMTSQNSGLFPPSPSTTPTGSSQTRGGSTPQTSDGGDTTTTQSESSSTANSGRRTRKRRARTTSTASSATGPQGSADNPE